MCDDTRSSYMALTNHHLIHCRIKLVLIGARRGGQPGTVASFPWNLKMMTSHAVPMENTLKFSLAPSTLASNTVKLSLTRKKKIAKISVRAFGAPENRSFFVNPRDSPPPLEKFLLAPMLVPTGILEQMLNYKSCWYGHDMSVICRWLALELSTWCRLYFFEPCDNVVHSSIAEPLFYSRRLASTAVNISIGFFFTVQDQIPKHTYRGRKVCVCMCVWHHSA